MNRCHARKKNQGLSTLPLLSPTNSISVVPNHDSDDSGSIPTPLSDLLQYANTHEKQYTSLHLYPRQADIVIMHLFPCPKYVCISCSLYRHISRPVKRDISDVCFFRGSLLLFSFLPYKHPTVSRVAVSNETKPQRIHFSSIVHWISFSLPFLCRHFHTLLQRINLYAVTPSLMVTCCC